MNKTLKIFLLIFILCTLIACGLIYFGLLLMAEEDNASSADSTSTENVFDSDSVQISKNEFTWVDSLVLGYINQTNNELIRLAFKNGIKEEWLLDRIESTDWAKYYVFRIGHTVADSGGMNPRYVTDEWLYVDSLTRRIFVHDIARDSLIEW
jgi:hypothetical protein